MRGLDEVVPIQDTFCSGVGGIEFLDGNLLRFWMYVTQRSDDDGTKEKLVVAKIVIPISAVPDAILAATAAIHKYGVALVPSVADMVN